MSRRPIILEIWWGCGGLDVRWNVDGIFDRETPPRRMSADGGYEPIESRQRIHLPGAPPAREAEHLHEWFWLTDAQVSALDHLLQSRAEGLILVRRTRQGVLCRTNSIFWGSLPGPSFCITNDGTSVPPRDDLPTDISDWWELFQFKQK